MAGLIPNPKFKKRILETAEAGGVKTQRNLFMGGLTDASYFHLVNEGIPALDLGFPVRYTHSPVETCDIQDIFMLVNLLKLFVMDDHSLSFPRV